MDPGPGRGFIRGMDMNANIDYCGVMKLLCVLEEHGFTKAELKKVAARVAAQIGADIILC